MSGLVIYVGASESGNACARAHVCIQSKRRCTIMFPISIKIIFSFYIVCFIFCLALTPIYAARSIQKRLIGPKLMERKVVTSEDLRRHGMALLVTWTHLHDNLDP